MKASLPILFALCSSAVAGDLSTLCADRLAIERVYYEHRLGTKPPFEQLLPPLLIEQLVKQELHKETVLKKVYGVEIAPAQMESEVQRINSTTRAPDMLAELKAALDHDAVRFARTVARPIVVERSLRERFENDDPLHAPQRRQMETIRAQLTNAAAAFRSSRGNEAPTEKSEIGNRKSEIDQSLLTSAATNDLVKKLLSLLKQSHSNDVSETTWQLGARPEEKSGAASPDEEESRKRFGPDAQRLTSPHGDEQERKFYFEDLPGELPKVLQAQLRQAGDVSAVIETPGGFLLYLARDKTSETLSVAALSLPKRSYDQWLAEQNERSK